MSYFMCRKAELDTLVSQARADAAALLTELSAFYRGDIAIDIVPEQHGVCWSVGADLRVNGELVRHEDVCDLLFLDLNSLMLGRLLKSGRLSMGATQ